MPGCLSYGREGPDAPLFPLSLPLNLFPFHLSLSIPRFSINNSSIHSPPASIYHLKVASAGTFFDQATSRQAHHNLSTYHHLSARHYHSRRSLHSPPINRTLSPGTPRTSSLCQSKISRPTVRGIASYLIVPNSPTASLHPLHRPPDGATTAQ